MECICILNVGLPGQRALDSTNSKPMSLHSFSLQTLKHTTLNNEQSRDIANKTTSSTISGNMKNCEIEKIEVLLTRVMHGILKGKRANLR